MGNPSLSKYRSADVHGPHAVVASAAILLWLVRWGSAAGAVAFEFDLGSGFGSYAPIQSYKPWDVFANEMSIPASTRERDMPTLYPGQCGDPKEKAEELFNGVKIGGPRDSVIAILSNCTRAERQRIREEYRKLHDADLVDGLREAYATTKLISTNVLQKLVISLTVSLPELLVERFAVAVDRHDFKVIRQVLTPGIDSKVLTAMSRISREKYGKDLREHKVGNYVLEKMTHTVYPKLRSIIDFQLQGLRSTNGTADYSAACGDARKIINERNAKRWNEDESDFHKILMTASFPHLRQVAKCFHDFERVPLEEAIAVAYNKNGFNNAEAGQAYAAIVRYADGKAAYFAKTLKTAVDDYDHDSLIFVITWRADIDLGNIKTVYRKWLQRSLYDDVAKLTSWFGNSRDYISLMQAVIRK